MMYKNSKMFYLFIGSCFIFCATQARTVLTIDPDTGRPVLVNDDDPGYAQKTQRQQQYVRNQQPQHQHNQQQQLQQQQHNNQQVQNQPVQQPAPQTVVRAGQQISAPAPDPIVPTHGLELKGCLRVDGLDKVPEYRIYFNGRQSMNNREGFYSFPVEAHEIDKMSLVICKGFKHNFDQKNTIKNVSVIPTKDYQFFTYRSSGFGAGMWIRSDKRFNHENFVIPEHCVVVLIDTQYVERVEEWTMPLATRFTKLPQIILKDESHADLKAESAKSLLASLDAKIFHASVNEVKRVAPNNPKIHMSLAQ